MLYRQSLLRGACFIIASQFMLACMGAVIKTAAVELPNEIIVFFRHLFGLLALLPLIIRHGAAGLHTRVPWLHVLRGTAGVSAMYCFFYAIAHIKLADAMLLKLTTPVFIPLLAYFWLRETMPWLARAALATGFVGVGLILKPGADFNWIVLVAVAGSMFAALAKVTVRKLSRTEPAFRTVFYFALVAGSVSAVPLLWAWQTPSPRGWLLLLAMGPLATLGQLFMTRGYAAAPASQVGIFTFSSALFGALFGWLFWDELWDAVSVLGALLIAVAGALALRSKATGAAASTPLVRETGIAAVTERAGGGVDR